MEGGHKFAFDHCYDSSIRGSKVYADQERVFSDLGAGLIANAWDGFNCSLFAYGQTGAGKSYSMTGCPGDDGLVPRMCKELFQRISANTDAAVSYEVELSFLEIYNEQLRDLLNPHGTKPLKLHDFPHGVVVTDLTRRAVPTYEAIQAALAAGNKMRTVAETLMNAQSSRSHSVFCIYLKQVTRTDEHQSIRECMINLADLAGSESQKKTAAEGLRLQEACAINKSLSALGNVIAALSSNKPRVPYKDSVLTRLLRQSLGGNSKTVMLAAVSPSPSNNAETLSTLRFASRAKLIKTIATVNITEDAQAKAARMEAEIKRLKQLLESQKASALSALSSDDSPILAEKRRAVVSLEQELVSQQQRFAKEANKAKKDALAELIKKTEEALELAKQRLAEEEATRSAEQRKQMDELQARMEAEMTAQRAELEAQLNAAQEAMERDAMDYKTKVAAAEQQAKQLDEAILKLQEEQERRKAVEKQLATVLDDIERVKADFTQREAALKEKADAGSLVRLEKQLKDQREQLEQEENDRMAVTKAELDALALQEQQLARELERKHKHMAAVKVRVADDRARLVAEQEEAVSAHHTASLGSDPIAMHIATLDRTLADEVRRHSERVPAEKARLQELAALEIDKLKLKQSAELKSLQDDVTRKQSEADAQKAKQAELKHRLVKLDQREAASKQAAAAIPELQKQRAALQAQLKPKLDSFVKQTAELDASSAELDAARVKLASSAAETRKQLQALKDKLEAAKLKAKGKPAELKKLQTTYDADVKKATAEATKRDAAAKKSVDTLAAANKRLLDRQNKEQPALEALKHQLATIDDDLTAAQNAPSAEQVDSERKSLQSAMVAAQAAQEEALATVAAKQLAISAKAPEHAEELASADARVQQELQANIESVVNKLNADLELRKQEIAAEKEATRLKGIPEAVLQRMTSIDRRDRELQSEAEQTEELLNSYEVLKRKQRDLRSAAETKAAFAEERRQQLQQQIANVEEQFQELQRIINVKYAPPPARVPDDVLIGTASIPLGSVIARGSLHDVFTVQSKTFLNVRLEVEIYLAPDKWSGRVQMDYIRNRELTVVVNIRKVSGLIKENCAGVFARFRFPSEDVDTSSDDWEVTERSEDSGHDVDIAYGEPFDIYMSANVLAGWSRRTMEIEVWGHELVTAMMHDPYIEQLAVDNKTLRVTNEQLKLKLERVEQQHQQELETLRQTFRAYQTQGASGGSQPQSSAACVLL
eukprot:TRINITY_DN8416_c0_g2_i1.p1 TRINITY_DN8416_c0_g2~~TRINITY_DN8416_c0_g2_i1.p1  ORF type:complete len:1295 (+),score=436.96 TRINITY_DN8416_c0_g2_i1:182-3886(+)